MTANKTITVFLVDDNALYLKTLEATFRSKEYYNIFTFATGELCLEKLSLKPDIIILDYYLNGILKDAINGLETLVKIRLVDPHVPIVILSVENDIEVAKNCIKHKASEFIVKGDISFARLREIITSIFIDKRSEKNLIQHLNKAIAPDPA